VEVEWEEGERMEDRAGGGGSTFIYLSLWGTVHFRVAANLQQSLERRRRGAILAFVEVKGDLRGWWWAWAGEAAAVKVKVKVKVKATTTESSRRGRLGLSGLTKVEEGRYLRGEGPTGFE
jgi:hypothetical protein